MLHLREGAAGRRIQAMKVLRRFPRLEGALRDGRLCISTIALLGQVLTEENLDDLLARAAYRTKVEVDHLVASVQARTAPRAGVRKLPERSPVMASTPLLLAQVEAPPQAADEPAPSPALASSLLDRSAPADTSPANLLYAERFFGREHMDRFRREQDECPPFPPDADARTAAGVCG